MKVYKVTLIEVDTDDEVNEQDIKDILENQRYPNHCMSPRVISVESREVGEWDEDGPLNHYGEAFDAEVARLFGASK